MSRTHNPWSALYPLLLGLFVMGVSTTSVNTAIPAISTGLGATFDELIWVINVYTLVLAVLIITAGRLGDLYGPKRLYLVGLSVFSLASILCGLAQSPTQLIVARFLQGVGAALVSPQSLSMISKVVPPERRGLAMGIWGTVAGGAVAVGPSLGGLIVTAWDWRWIFLVNVPVCVLTVVISAVVIPDLPGGRRHRFDVLGSALATVGLFLIIYGLIEGHSHRWGSVWGPVSIPMIIAAGVVVLGLLAVVERGRQDREPLLPFAILRDRNFSLMAAVTVTLIGAVGAILLLLSIYLQSAVGMTALAAGMVMAIAPTVSTVFAPISGRLTDRLGGKYLLIAGLVLFAAGLVYVVLVAGVDSTWWDLMPGLTLVGIAMGVVFAPPIAIAMDNIDTAIAGAAAGTLNTIRTFGAVIGAALVGAIVQARLAVSLREASVAQADGLPPALRETLHAEIARASAGGLKVGEGQFTIDVPPGMSEAAAAALRQAGQRAFDAGLTDAVRFTFLLPAALLLVSALLTLAVRPRPPATVEPAPAPESPLSSQTPVVTGR